MSPAKVSINNIYVEITHKKRLSYFFMATNESILFDGYLKVYNLKSEDDELQKANLNLKTGKNLYMKKF